MSSERLKLVLGLCCTAQFSVCTHMPRLAAGLSGLFRAHLSAACSIDFSHACWRTCAGDRLTSFGCGLPHAAVSGLRASAVSLRDTSYTLHVSLKTRFMGLCAVQHSFEISQRTELILNSDVNIVILHGQFVASKLAVAAISTVAVVTTPWYWRSLHHVGCCERNVLVAVTAD